MGAAASSILGPEGDGGSPETGLGDLPESCIAEVMLHLDPPGICKLAKISRTFRGAASGDFLWETKLPSNYHYLLQKATDNKEFEIPMSKKEIFARLCRQNAFDGGTKEFWLEKYRGRFCMCISSKAFLITGIDDRRYWNLIPTEESRFLSVAYLKQIWWFEVVGEIEFCFPPGTYSLYFRLHLGRPCRRLGRRICNTGHIHGWDIKPVRFQLWTSDGQHALCQSVIDDPGCWIRYHVGDFEVVSADFPIKVKFSMEQIDCTHTKGGLCVDSVLIYPKELRQGKLSSFRVFLSVAYLKQIWWFEVVGEIEFCFPPGTYSLYFRLHLGRPCRRLGRRICNTGHIHGWDIKPVRFQLWTSDGQHALCQSVIDDPGCWIRYHVGDFEVVSADFPIKVKFSMEQIDCTHTKGGLCVDSVLIYPKELRQGKLSSFRV